MLEAIVKDTDKSGSLTDLRLATACLLAFSGFWRFNELICLRSCDLEISQEMMTIKVLQSKTDQLKQGNELVTARTGNFTCPVVMLKKYMDRTGMSLNDQITFLPYPENKERQRSKAVWKNQLHMLKRIVQEKGS